MLSIAAVRVPRRIAGGLVFHATVRTQPHEALRATAPSAASFGRSSGRIATWIDSTQRWLAGLLQPSKEGELSDLQAKSAQSLSARLVLAMMQVRDRLLRTIPVSEAFLAGLPAAVSSPANDSTNHKHEGHQHYGQHRERGHLAFRAFDSILRFASAKGLSVSSSSSPSAAGASAPSSSSSPTSTIQSIRFVQPPGVSRSQLLADLRELAKENHSTSFRGLVLWVLAVPLTSLMTVLPGPNVFLAWNVYRIFMNYRVWVGCHRLLDVVALAESSLSRSSQVEAGDDVESDGYSSIDSDDEEDDRLRRISRDSSDLDLNLVRQQQQQQQSDASTESTAPRSLGSASDSSQTSADDEVFCDALEDDDVHFTWVKSRDLVLNSKLTPRSGKSLAQVSEELALDNLGDLVQRIKQRISA